MVIHESAEDYLESILVLQQRRGQVRSIDIVNELGYSKPSVSIAMKKLRENGYISMDADGFITLNESGLEVASRVYGRHKTLSKLFCPSGSNAGGGLGGCLQGGTRPQRGDVPLHPAVSGKR